MRRLGYFFHMGAHIQSAAELAIEIGIEVIQASIGVRSEACSALTPVPMWQQITTSLSAQAFHTGSQWSEWIEGNPCSAGLSEREIA